MATTSFDAGVARPSRYPALSVALHWVMALSFLSMLTSGYLMVNYGGLSDGLKFNMFQWHKGGGVLLLLAAIARLAIKLLTAQPALPSTMIGWEKAAAKVGHWGFYGFMLAMPLTGWLMVSASVYGLPTIVFGWFEWPHIPGVAGNEGVQKTANQIHFLLSLAFAATILTHIGATIKHSVVEGHNLLPRMWFARMWQPLTVLAVLAGSVIALNTLTSGANVTAAASQRAQPVSGYGVDYARSSVSFSGVHAGNTFTGTFAQWDADIQFTPANLAASDITVTFDLASASTGNSMYDGTLPNADWFDIETTPTGVFTSQTITPIDGGYHMVGTLELRGKALPVEFDFTLDATDGVTHVVAQLPIDRMAYDIGANSDPDASWVSQEITVALDIYAAQSGAQSGADS